MKLKRLVLYDLEGLHTGTAFALVVIAILIEPA
jgi:hypothetical protein